MKKPLILLTLAALLLPTTITFAQAEFNPQFIISDEEMQSTANWTTADIQKFLEDRGSYLATLRAEDLKDTSNPLPKLFTRLLSNIKSTQNTYWLLCKKNKA
jgi:hypothetical protein